MNFNNFVFVPQLKHRFSRHHHHHHQNCTHMNPNAPTLYQHLPNIVNYQQQGYMGHNPLQVPGFPFYNHGSNKYIYNRKMNQRPLEPSQQGANKNHGDVKPNQGLSCSSVEQYEKMPSLENVNYEKVKKQPATERYPNKYAGDQQQQKSEKFDNNTKNNNTKNDNSTQVTPAALNTMEKAVTVKVTEIMGWQQKKDDTMQRNSSKASHSSSSSAPSASSATSPSTNTASSKNHHHHHYNNKDHHHSSSASKNQESSDSGISIHNGGHRHNAAASSAKQKKCHGNSKHKDAAAAANNGNSPSHTEQKNLNKASDVTVNGWLQNGTVVYRYERQFISSCREDNRIARHNPTHRNSTSSEAAGSDEDLCSAYIIQSKTVKKSAKTRQKRQQKCKQLPCSASTGNGSGANKSYHGAKDLQSMDFDEDYKENRKPANTGGKQNSSSSAALNLRKQCTKAEAFKAAKLAKSSSNALTTSASSSSVCSSMSSASSVISTNSSSSASSSPTNSANSSPTASPTASKRNADHLKKVAQALLPPLSQFIKLNETEAEIVLQMKHYVIDPSTLRIYGFPVESVLYEGCIEFYKCLPKHMAEEAITQDNQRHHRHYYGRKKSKVINDYDGLAASTAIDSGNGSGDSSPRSTDSDPSELSEDDVIASEPIMAFYTPDGVYQIFTEYNNSSEKQCVRCSKMFQVNEKGEYQTFDECTYHWGKLSSVFNGTCYVNVYSCCQGGEHSEGCCHHHLHVWNGAVVGINGPYTDYVHTKPRNEKQRRKSPNIYAMDCEMSYTGLGLEVTKVTVVAYDGTVVYEHFILPRAQIVDYNTRFSGVSEKDLSPHSNNSIKTFAQAQADLLKLFDADTILVGHALDNDLRALKLVHKTVVDTSLIFKHSTGFPYRRSLKNLTNSFLRRDIQCGDMGHSSLEDSRACLELMMWKIRKDLRLWVY